MVKNIDLLLVNPGNKKQVYGKLGPSLSGIEPPIWAGLIAAFVREKGFVVKIFDAEAEDLTFEETAKRIKEMNPILLGIVVMGSNPSASSTPKMTATRELIEAVRKETPELKIIISGLHPSSLPELTLKEEKVDFLAQGEGFQTHADLLNTLKSGKNDYKINGLWYTKDNKVFSNPRAPLIKDLDSLPFVAWDLLPMEKYRAHNWHCFEHIDKRSPYAVIYTSLGCPFNCSYCNVCSMYDGKPGIRFRSPEKVVEEIDYLVKNYKIKNIKFLDELFAINEERVLKICELLIERGYDLNIWAYARVNTITENMLKKMRKAGIKWLAYGFESGSDRVRKGVDKLFDQDVMNKAVEMTHNAGVYIMGNFIFGLPDDDLKSMKETFEMAKSFNCEYINFYTAMAYPGSKLYDDCIKNGVKLPEKWHGFSQYNEETLPLPTKYLSSGEVLRFRDKAFKEYFSRPEYLKMIRTKFGEQVVEHIKEMLKHEIKRKYA